ncbi:Nucleolar protein 12 [Entomophthora muscae]|uniref:Nucleolar protein 12 n=1 Tax=Entomophthora muscae TaxID=34485 RepID=A0ACC2UCH1_9FUNG|nr:Nucleolar protein 12 [Entomophthora muscae]
MIAQNNENSLASLFLKNSAIDSELDDIFQKGSFNAAKVTVPPVSNKSEEAEIIEEKPEEITTPATPKASQKRVSKKSPVDPSVHDRTLFVGNVSLEAIEKVYPLLIKIDFSKEGKKIFTAYFSKFGKVQSVRFRSLAFEKQTNRKAAFIKKEFHPKRTIVNAYVVFETKEAALKSLKANATVLFNKHLRVDSVGNEEKDYPKKSSVFIGNIPLDIEEEDIWQHFEKCGKVCGVRVVRDKSTNLGKGFGYVLFESPSSVQLALNLAGSSLAKREIRVTRCLDSKTNNNAKRPHENMIIEGERAVKGAEKPPKKSKKSSKSSSLRAKNWKSKQSKK